MGLHERERPSVAGGLLDEAGAVDALDGFVVAAEEGVPANDGDVLQHP